jgi:VWFA-related protein
MPQILTLLLCTGLAAFPRVLATQKAAAAQAAQAEKQIRISVGLVQTDVMVFDKQGHFVPNLKKEQFELRIDGKVQPIQFFEMVSAGSPHDEEIWAKAEGKPAPEAAQRPAARMPNPGRTLFIFLDDWHMEADSTMRTRNAVASLLNTSMGPNDRVGIVAATGQLAATQFLTNDKATLLASLEKFNFKNPGVQDLTYPAMSEVQAQAIEQNDYNTIAYFVGGIVGAPVVYSGHGWGCPTGCPRTDFGRAELDTRQRARTLAQMSAVIGMRTLSALRGLLQFAESLPGRKLIFFLSDGFMLQYQQSDMLARLTDLTSAAARAGIIIYSLDSRGLVTGTADVKTKPAPDVTGQRMTMAANEVSAPWDALNALASDTGGRFLKNTNALDTALITSLKEMSRYYLMGWPIDPENLRPGKTSTIKASIKGRSDLRVRVRQGTLDLSKLVREKK